MTLKRTVNGILATALLGLLLAPYQAAAQTVTKTYEVTLTNITTSKQALSPVVVATHSPSVHAWQMGKTASKGLELLAEDGKPDMLAPEWQGIATDVATTHAHLLPGDSITVRITARQGDVLSAASMLIQTNDGFTGLDSIALADGNIDAMIYDAGTEENTELAAHIPGPPFGGLLAGPGSNPRQPISSHGGISGKAQVMSDYNWSGPVARFSIRPIDSVSVVPGTYEVTLKNITTSKQALSPVVLATHSSSVHAWQMGQMSSKGLELLAEDGKPDMLADELRGMTTDVAATHAHLLPGDSITLMIRAKEGDVLSAASMLIQTNDGFTGLDSAALTQGSMSSMIYDAGTEENSELKADIPGFFGPLHGPDSNPRQPISMHGGITGRGEVPADFNWSEPVAQFSIRAVDAANVTSNVTPVGMPRTGESGGQDILLWLSLLGVVFLVGGVLTRDVRRRNSN